VISGNKKLKKLIKEFSPDAVFVDRQNKFGLEIIKNNIPLFVYLRGNIWLEHKWAKETIYKDPIMRTVANQRHKIANEGLKSVMGCL